MEVIPPFLLKRQHPGGGLGSGRLKRRRFQDSSNDAIKPHENRRFSSDHAENDDFIGIVSNLPTDCSLGASSGATELASSAGIVQPLQQQVSLTREFGDFMPQAQSYPIIDCALSVPSHTYIQGQVSTYNPSAGSQDFGQPLLEQETWTVNIGHLLPQAQPDPIIDNVTPIPSQIHLQDQVSADSLTSRSPNAVATPGLFEQTQSNQDYYQNTVDLAGMNEQLVFLDDNIDLQRLLEDNEIFRPTVENASYFSAWPEAQPENPSEEELELPRNQLSDGSEWLEVGYDGTTIEENRQALNHQPRSEEQASGTLTPISRNNQSYGDSSSKRRPRGRFKNMKKREETSITRQHHACVRCRMQRVRCTLDEDDPSGVCITCKKVLKPTIHKLPCIRLILTDCTLYRVGNLGYTMRWPEMKMTEITDWDSTDTRTSTIKTSLPGFKLRIKFRKFRPINGDQLRRTWMDGKAEKHYPITPFAIASMEETAQNFRFMVDSVTFDCIDAVLERDNADLLIRRTYDIAKQHTHMAQTREECALMENVLRMWFMVNLSIGSAWLEGRDTLDMRPIEDPLAPLYGRVPNPPISSAQMDILGSIKILRPLQKKILDDLQRMVISNKPQYWITIYLCIFVLLHNCATLTADRYRHARKHALNTRYSLPRFVEELHSGANNLLTHFHYYKGDMDPFFVNWKKRHTTRLAHLTPYEIGFLIHTSELIKDKYDEFRVCKEWDQFEHPLYFVSQMYEKDWSPRDFFRSPV